jgi:uracil-DNA glycosylase
MDSPRLTRATGPKDAKIVLVGEAPGKQEELTGMPFMGESGQELTRMLKEAGIDRSSCYLTNVLTVRPPDNKLDEFCAPKGEVGAGYTLPPLGSGKYLRPEFLPELDRLRAEIEEVNPNVVVALGGTASWALLRAPKISSVRGTVAPGVLTKHKVIPTFHPAAIIRNWAQRVLVVADLLKAERESHFPEVRRPERKIYYDPTLAELQDWVEYLNRASILGTDIETKLRTITCIGFAPSRSEAFVVPFFDPRNTHGSYWHSLDEELEAWGHVESILSGPARKVFQNGLYDIQYILRMGLKLRNVSDDTMILHHAMYPELQKSLGFLGSIYTNEASWKLLRPRGDDSNKREDE